MRAVYCDRCKKLFQAKDDPNSRITFDRYVNGEGNIFDGDLCPKCQDKLEDWLERKK